MSNPPADSLPLPQLPGGDWPAGPKPPSEGWLAGPEPPREGWTRKKFFSVLAIVLALHVALIFLLGTKKQIVPRPVTNVPHLQLADGTGEFIALGDPTLFARPNEHDLVTGFWRRMPAVVQPNFNWTEAPRYLLPAPADFGALFREFVRNSQAAQFPLNFKPEPKLTASAVTVESAMPQVTTMQISGELAGRKLLNAVALPSLRRNDVIAPSHIQVLVDNAGNVLSLVVLEPNADAAADQRALQLVRSLRFAPAPDAAFGEITFTWHTVPTNSAPATTVP